MYNRTQKEEFLKYFEGLKAGKTSQIDRAVLVLQRIEKFETEWNTDICLQTDVVELQKIVDELGFISSGSSSGQLLALKEYCRWCHDVKKVANSSLNILSIQPSGWKLKNKTFDSPLSLQIHLNKIFSREQENTIHNVYRAFAWLAYIGFTESEAFEITCDDVDLESMKITHNDCSFHIYHEAYHSIKSCTESKCFLYINKHYTDPSMMRSRIDGNLLLRGFKANPDTHLNTEFSRMQTAGIRAGIINKQVTYDGIWMSGVFYRSFQNEQAGFGIPGFHGIAIREWKHNQKRRKGIDVEFDPLNDAHVKRVHIIETTLKRDYKKWKQYYYNNI